MTIDIGALTKRRDVLRAKIRACTGCGLSAANPPVPFHGNVHTPKMIVMGEAPGEVEVANSKPFLGPSGRLLWGELGKLGINRSDTFMLNSVSCRPQLLETNRPPSRTELDACKVNVVLQLALVSDCRFVLALGNTALNWFFPGKSIGKVNATPLYVERDGRPGRIIVPCFHPAAVLRDAELLEKFRTALELMVAMVRLGDSFSDIWPTACVECGSEKVYHYNESGLGLCGGCYMAKYQLVIPGVVSARAGKHKVKRAKVGTRSGLN